MTTPDARAKAAETEWHVWRENKWDIWVRKKIELPRDPKCTDLPGGIKHRKRAEKIASKLRNKR